MKNFGEGFMLSIKCWFQSWSFISKHGLMHFFLYPIIISIVLSMGVFALLFALKDKMVNLATAHIHYTAMPNSNWYERILELLSNISGYAIAFFVSIIGLYFFQRTKKYIVLALMSPVMSLLSERTDEILTNTKYSFDGKQLVRDVARGIVLAVRNFLLETALGIGIWVATMYLTIFTGFVGGLFIPFVALLSFGISSYFYGFATMDYTNERKRMGVQESITVVRNNKGIAVGNGTIFNLLMLLPFLGATVATITCTVAATLALHQNEHSKKKD
jgi:CysZ protein